MFNNLLLKLGLLNVIYFKVNQGRVSVRDVWGGVTLEGTDEIVIETETNRVISVGALGGRVPDDIKIPIKRIFVFSGQHLLESVRLEAEALVKYYIRMVKQRFLLISPLVIIHFLDRDMDAASSQAQALKKIFSNCGAREVCVWKGTELTDQEIKDNVFRR